MEERTSPTSIYRPGTLLEQNRQQIALFIRLALGTYIFVKVKFFLSISRHKIVGFSIITTITLPKEKSINPIIMW